MSIRNVLNSYLKGFFVMTEMTYTEMAHLLSRYLWSANAKDATAYHNPICVADELRQRFDVLVDMDAHHTAPKGTTMATFGLCGCIGGYVDNPDTNTFFHYSPLSTSVIDLLTQQQVSDKTSRVHFFVPGEWQKDSDGRYERQPKSIYVDQLLAASICRIRSMGVECLFHCYDEDRSSGDDYMARSQGTAWIDKNGQLFAEGAPIRIEGIPIRTMDRKIGAKPSENNRPT